MAPARDSNTSADVGSRGVFRLGFGCDNACVFCGQAGLDAALELPTDALARLREQHDELTFIGGEPTLDSRLLGAVAHARELGFSAIGLQTNGRRLAAEPQLFADLVEAGLSDLHLSIHGPSSDAHDYHTDRPGSLAASVELMARAQRASITTVVTTVVTRSNFRELAKLPPALKRRGVEGWLLEVVRPYGRAADNFARVVPRFGMALPWALHALEQARRHALSAWIRGAPVCALGPFAASSLPSEPRAYPPPCAACPSRSRCAGVDPAYLQVFGAGELRAGAAVEPASFDSGRHRLMRMFVGVGELVERPPQLVSPARETPADEGAPAGKNRRLPVLANTSGEQAKSEPQE